jgi:hypothetical protein
VPAPLPSVAPGKRALIAGKTGSGKTTLATWFMLRSYQHWLILNPKHTAIYRTLPDAVVYRKFDPRGVYSDIQRRKYVVLELSGYEATREYMDGIIAWLQSAVNNVGLCVDELYTLHSAGGHAGDGLIGWITRGREKKQTMLGLTQRPAWLSRFLFSETDYLCAMLLNLSEDRERMYEVTGDRHFLERVTEYRWLWYDDARNSTTLYGPVPEVKPQHRSLSPWARLA